MRNLFTIPSKKPSRLLFEKISNRYYTNSRRKENTKNVQNQNIYITSDEEIKEGDYWVKNITIDLEMPFKLDSDGILYTTLAPCKFRKIILTTDQDLIADGVQAIDDELLEWFVKNPSCEEIFVNTIESFDFGIDKYVYDYKIIIPKDEATQTLGVDFEFSIDDNGMCIEIPIPKQETLEEAAERFYSSEDSQRDCNFIEGAKWQQEDKQFFNDDRVKTLEKSIEYLLNKLEQKYSIDDLKEAFAMGRLGKTIGEFNNKFKKN